MSAPSGPRVRMVQILCPKRHCIVASAYQSEDGKEDSIYQWRIRETYRELGGVERCGLCGSTELTVEDSPTVFRTLEEAEPVFRMEEIKQRAARALIDATRRAELN